jgi:hypothetical protein
MVLFFHELRLGREEVVDGVNVGELRRRSFV